jgi:hypothetical protein
MHPNDKWAIHTLNTRSNGHNIAQAIIAGTAVAVCDGLYKNQFGTAGFVIQRGDSKESRIIGAHVMPGHPTEINPYCSKLGGILAIVVIIEAIVQLHDIRQGTIELGYDDTYL